MITTFEHLILKDELSQSSIFGSQYKEILENTNVSSFSNTFIEDIEVLYINILVTYNKLSSFQKDMLEKIFNQFNIIRTAIDPKRLKPFKYFFNEDNELLLYRENSHGLINIIINPEDCIAFSFISRKEKKDVFYFVEYHGDFEKLAYDFLS